MTAFYKKISHILRSLPGQKEVDLAIINNGKSSVLNLPPSLDALVFARSLDEHKRNILLVFEEAIQAERAFDDLAKLVEEDKLVLFSQTAQQSAIKEELHKNTAAAESFC